MENYPKEARLLKSKDFRFRTADRIRSRYFQFVVCPSRRARLGISVSKKVLPNAVARNRVRRLIREAFRKTRPQASADIHIVAIGDIKEDWKYITQAEVNDTFKNTMDRWVKRMESHG